MPKVKFNRRWLWIIPLTPIVLVVFYCTQPVTYDFRTGVPEKVVIINKNPELYSLTVERGYYSSRYREFGWINGILLHCATAGGSGGLYSHDSGSQSEFTISMKKHHRNVCQDKSGSLGITVQSQKNMEEACVWINWEFTPLANGPFEDAPVPCSGTTEIPLKDYHCETNTGLGFHNGQRYSISANVEASCFGFPDTIILRD